jgi:hypothetical protein
MNKNPKMTDYAMVHNFLGAMENPFRSHKLWKDGDEQDMLEVMDALEAYILSSDMVVSRATSTFQLPIRDMAAGPTANTANRKP